VKSALKVKRLERVEKVIGGRVKPSAAANNGILKAQGRTSSGSLLDLKATDRHKGGWWGKILRGPHMQRKNIPYKLLISRAFLKIQRFSSIFYL